MKARDKAIIKDLERFRCMSRDDIAEIHFGWLKNPITNANYVLKRLRRDGYVDVNVQERPYVYFPSGTPFRRDSQKIRHYLAIVDFYKQIIKYELPRLFDVEPKYGKGNPEPDAFMVWLRTPFFVEIQRSLYSDKVMAAKLDRYEAYYYSREWEREPWQPEARKVFPYLWLISEKRYNVGKRPFKVIQTRDVGEFMSLVRKPVEGK